MIRPANIVLGLAYLASAGLATAQNPDYKALHNMLIQFYGYQRAGDKTIDNKNPFYKTAPFPHSADGSQLGGKDLSSGWYDAGDFVKFGLPLGFSVYCLLKGYDVFPRAYDDVTSWDYKGTPDNIPDILGEVKIATDYLQRAVVSASQVVVDVGNGPADHGQLQESGYQNSQRIPNREVYTNAGADVAGLYAASLALMAKLYKPHDAAYSAACLAKAKEAYQFGTANKRLSTQQNDPATGKPFYVTTTYLDKLAAAAVELYRATGEATYLEQAKTHLGAVKQHYYVLGYANVGDLPAFELKRLGVAGAEGNWITDVSQTMARVVTAASASNLIKGAFINSDWGNAGNAACAGFSAALAFMVTGEEKYLTFARNQAHWVAGLSPFSQSYVVGFGNGTSIQPHHRNDVTKLNGVRLKGGVVSGPSPSGGFDPAKPEASSWSFNGSDPGNYKNTEVALNYNAGMVGLVAFLRDYDNPPAGQVRIKTPLTSTPQAVDLNTGKVTIAGAVEPAAAWKVILTGRISRAKRTVAGTGAAVSVSWAGEADSGSFVAGEVVEAMLDTSAVAAYHHSRAKTSFSITATKKEAFKTTDVKVDDFEDGDVSSAQGGAWSVFGDGTSTTSPQAVTQAVLAGEGEGGSKGLAIRLTPASTVTPRPFVGVKCAFNAAGTAVGLGQALSIVFDVKATAGSSLWIELEQTDIADGAFFGRKIDLATDGWNRIRIPMANLEQPAWKTASKGLNIGSVKSLRITNYGPASVRFSLDNLHIEGLSVQAAPVRFQGAASGSVLAAVRAGRDGLRYVFQPPEAVAEEWKAEVLDAFGRTLEARNLGRVTAGKSVEFPGLRLNPGWYFLRHTAEGATRELIQRIHVRPDSP